MCPHCRMVSSFLLSFTEQNSPVTVEHHNNLWYRSRYYCNPWQSKHERHHLSCVVMFGSGTIWSKTKTSIMAENKMTTKRRFCHGCISNNVQCPKLYNWTKWHVCMKSRTTSGLLVFYQQVETLHHFSSISPNQTAAQRRKMIIFGKQHAERN